MAVNSIPAITQATMTRTHTTAEARIPVDRHGCPLLDMEDPQEKGNEHKPERKLFPPSHFVEQLPQNHCQQSTP